MVILYGTKKFKRVKGQTRTNYHCTHCGKDSRWQLINLWTWFTLFYIPLLPVNKKRMLICPFCNWGVKINNDNIGLLNNVDYYK